MTGARRVALFASGLQRSDAPTAAMAAEAITATVRRVGIHGCLSLMAQEFGDHPDMAAARMRWICQLTAQMPAWLPRPPGAGRPGSKARNEIHPQQRPSPQAGERRGMNQTCDRCGPAVRAAYRAARDGELYFCRHCTIRLRAALSAHGWAIWPIGQPVLVPQAG